MPAIYDSASKALARLDFEADNAALAECAAEGEKLSAAMRKAEARIAEVQAQLTTILQDRMADKKAAVAVADALLGEADASQATATVVRERDLRDEQASLRAGLRELQDRSRDNSDAMARIKSTSLAKVRPALEPVVNSLIADAQAAAGQIGQAFASIAAISGATRQFNRETRVMGEALAKLMGTDLIARNDVIATPDAIAEMLSPLADKGPSAFCHVPTYAGVPDDHSAIGLIAGMAAREAVG